MPFYTEKQHVKSFRHRAVMVDIYLRVKGASHCGIEHEPEKHQTCNGCGEPLAHKDVFNIAINGSELAGLDLKDEQQATDLGTKFVDHLLDDQDEELEDIDLMPPEDEELIDEDPYDEDEEDDEITLNDPPNPPPNQGRKNTDWGSTEMGNIVQQMNKLKWFDRAAAIVKGRKGKRLKKK